MKLSAAFTLAALAAATTTQCAPILIREAGMSPLRLDADSTALLAAAKMHALPVTVSSARIDTAEGFRIVARDMGDSSVEELKARGPSAEVIFEAIDVKKAMDEFIASFDGAGGKPRYTGSSSGATAPPNLNSQPHWASESEEFKDALGRLQSRVRIDGQADVKALETLKKGLGDEYAYLFNRIDNFRKMLYYWDDPEAARAKMNFVNRKRKANLVLAGSLELPTPSTPASQQNNIAIISRFESRTNKHTAATALERAAARALVTSEDVPKVNNGRYNGRIKTSDVSSELREAYDTAVRILSNERNNQHRKAQRAAKQAAPGSLSGGGSSTSTANPYIFSHRDAPPATTRAYAPLDHHQNVFVRPSSTSPAALTAIPALYQPSLPPTLKAWPLLDLNKSPDQFTPSPGRD